MESSSLGPDHTPKRATSEGPNPPPRNSMEDADSSVTRKRPRLDSGDRVYRSMSADRLVSSHPESDPGMLLPAQDSRAQHGENEKLPDDVSSTHPIIGTPSKVTINVRDPVLRSSPPEPMGLETEVSQAKTPRQDQTHFPAKPIKNVQSKSPRAVSISSSPARSPEIEVAELEDMDGHSGPTVWRDSEDSIGFDDLQISLLDEFPMADRHTNLVQAVHRIAQTINYRMLLLFIYACLRVNKFHR